MKHFGEVNRRRFERVPMALDWGVAQAIVGAEWHWANHEVGQVFDMSYQGLAVAQAALAPCSVNQMVRGELVLGGVGKLSLNARVAWTKGTLAGLEIKDVSLEARQAFEKFLKDKLIGLSMKRVEPKFFLETADFSTWYHGPGDTNIYLWQNDGGQILRAEVEIGGALLTYDRGVVAPQGDSELVRRVMALLTQINEPQTQLKDLLAALSKGLP